KKSAQASQSLANSPEMQILQRAQNRSLEGKLENNNKHFAGEYADYPKIAETSLSPRPSASHAPTHTATPHTTKPPLNNQTPLLPYKPNTHIPATTK
ncbi:hypothetical protein FNE76_08155, partial [Helicobacter mehlei]